MPECNVRLLYFTLMLALGGCAGAPELQLDPIGDVIPAGVDFSGRWQLRGPDSAQRAPLSGGTNEGIVIPPERARGAARASSRPKKGGPSVYVFIETGRRLKITQTDFGLFISFDRSVVEEYRFREHRMVSVGPIEALRVSGWRDGHYEIQTLDGEGALLTETYALREKGQQLVRTLAVVYKEERMLSIEQLFDRIE